MLIAHLRTAVTCSALVWIFTGCPESPREVSSAEAETDSVALSAEPVPEIPSLSVRPPQSCFAPESLSLAPLVFGNITVSEETGDYSGIEFRFTALDSRVTAAVRDAAGGLPAPRPVDSLYFDPAVDSITVWTSQYGSTSYVHRFAVRCGILDGNARLFITKTNPLGQLVQIQLVRVEDPLPDNP